MKLEKRASPSQNAQPKMLQSFAAGQPALGDVMKAHLIKIKSQKTYELGDMVLVKASGQVILAYTKDAKARRVTTAQGIELETVKVWGRAFERLENEGEFKQPKTN